LIRKSPLFVLLLQTILFISGLIFVWAVSTGLMNYVTGINYWIDSTEVVLAAYVYIQALLVIPCTILPGRMARAEASIAEESLAQKQAYVRFVSHEIRSPLSVVTAGLELIQKDLESMMVQNGLPGLLEVLELVRNVSEASETAIDVVNDLLQYESIEAGQLGMEMVNVQPENLVKPGALSMIATRNNIQFAVVFPQEFPQDCFVLADVYRIEQVVRNLVTNACKFTPTGGTVTVSLTASLREGSLKYPSSSSEVQRIGVLRIEVADDGVGISKDDQGKLFEQFVQFNRNKLQAGGGSGLGLWIARNIVRLHSGILEFKSDGVGKGTSFYFELPLFSGVSSGTSSDTPSISFSRRVHQDFTSTSLPASLLATQVGSSNVLTVLGPDMIANAFNDAGLADVESGLTKPCSPNATKPLSFLIVDDLPMNRKILRRMIESEDAFAGCKFQESEDGSDVLELVLIGGFPAEHSFILIDSVMKNMHGPETVRALRFSGFKGCIIGVTGNALPCDVDDFMKSGLDAIILKPLKRQGLMKTLASAGVVTKLL
jgi:signal transduction histidine kinase